MATGIMHAHSFERSICAPARQVFPVSVIQTMVLMQAGKQVRAAWALHVRLAKVAGRAHTKPCIRRVCVRVWGGHAPSHTVPWVWIPKGMCDMCQVKHTLRT